MALLFRPSLASAQPTADDAQVRGLVTVARSAFENERYGEAVRALEECLRLTKDPNYLWSIGHAAEKSYWAAEKNEDLRKAVDSYRAYLRELPSGKRRLAATSNLKKLEPLLPKPAVDAQGTPVNDAPPAAARTGVMISSPTPGARIELDGKLRANGFLVADVEAGPHRVRVVADGFLPVERDVPVQPGALIGVDIALSPKPALVAIDGPSGAELYVDGELKGELPLARPLALAPGDRLIAVQKSGAHSMIAWKSVERGASYTIDADLTTTGQRYVAWGSFTVAAGAALTAGVLTGLAFQTQSEADDIVSPVSDGEGSIEHSQLAEFDAAIADRDLYRTGAGIAWGLAGAGLIGGVFLYVFDRPTVQAPPPPPRQKGAEPDQRQPDAIELSVLPSLGPSLSGIAISGRF